MKTSWKEIFKKTSQYLEHKLTAQKVESLLAFFESEKAGDLESDISQWGYFPTFLRMRLNGQLSPFVQELAFLEFHLWFFDQDFIPPKSASKTKDHLQLHPDMTFLPVFFNLEKILLAPVEDWTDDFLNSHRDHKVLVISQPTPKIEKNFLLGGAECAAVIDTLSDHPQSREELAAAAPTELIELLISRNFIGHF